jgi:hypothetical protein
LSAWHDGERPRRHWLLEWLPVWLLCGAFVVLISTGWHA